MTITDPDIPPDVALPPWLEDASYWDELPPDPERDIEQQRFALWVETVASNDPNVANLDSRGPFPRYLDAGPEWAAGAPFPPPPSPPSPLLSPKTQFLETLNELVDEVVTEDRTVNRAIARRVLAIDKARRHVEAHTGTQIDPEATARAKESGGWTDEVVARTQLISTVSCAMGVTESYAGQLIHHSHMLTEFLPRTLEALLEGAISYKHATVMVDHADTLPKDARAAFDEQLAPIARQTSATKLDRRARYLREKMHPDSIRERHVKAKADRCMSVEPTRDGMAYLTFFVPAPLAFGIFNRFANAAATMKCKTESRTQTQIRVDLATDVLLHGEPSDGRGRGVIPTVFLTVPALSLLGRSDEPAVLEGYGPIDQVTAKELVGNAPSFIRVLTHPETGVVLSIGKQRYTIPKAMRRWLQFQDQTCRFVSCTTPATRCDLDHTVEWHEGGSTEVQNLSSLCERHHKMKTYTAWTVEQLPGRVLRWTDEIGREYLTEPAVPIGPQTITSGDTNKLTPEEIDQVRQLTKFRVPSPNPELNPDDVRDPVEGIAVIQHIHEAPERSKAERTANAECEASAPTDGDNPGDLPF
jgi:hypothetical protein